MPQCPSRSALGAALLPAVVLPAQATELITTVRTLNSTRIHNSNLGVVVSTGTGGGSTGIGGPVSTSFVTGSDPFGPSSGNASATVDLTTGSLGMSASGSGPGGFGSGEADMTENVTFHVAGASASTLTNIVVDHTLDGNFSIEQSAGYRYSFSMQKTSGPFGGSLGWIAQFYDSPTDPRNGYGWANYGGTGYPDGWQSWELLSGTADQFHFRGVLAIPGIDSEFTIGTLLNLNCSAPTSCDFSHTAKLNFDLPANVTFTSESGLLLTAVAEVPVPVPEPSPASLLLCGLALLGVIGRRRWRQP